MHPISDKELDKLFQQRFEEAEFQPSDDVWGKITAKMDQKEEMKRSFPVLWMAAASVVILLSAGLWFYRPSEVIRLQGIQQKMVHNIIQDDPGATLPVTQSVPSNIKGYDFSKIHIKDNKKVTTVAVSEEIPEETPNQITEALAPNNIPKRNIQEISEPGKEVKVARYTGDQSQLDVTQPDMIASAEIPPESLVPEPETSSPRKIRSIGSLVNFVISKVDHRNDKIIEFKDGDEGSEVSGINLGLLRLKNKNRSSE